MTHRKHIEVVPYSSEWPSLFEKESLAVRRALKGNCLAVHHVGSTSVPGLAAKPKIDMLAVVKEPSEAISALEAVGYTYRGEFNIPMHYGFSKRGAVDVNLHVYEEGNPEIELNLVFRDYLRQHASARDAYSALKMSLLEDETSREKSGVFFTNYTLRKGDFIRSVLKDAGFNRLRILKCNDETEWRAAHELAADADRETFHQPGHEHLVLYRGTEIVGYAHLHFLPHQQVVISAVRVMQADSRDEFLSLVRRWICSQRLEEVSNG